MGTWDHGVRGIIEQRHQGHKGSLRIAFGPLGNSAVRPFGEFGLEASSAGSRIALIAEFNERAAEKRSKQWLKRKVGELEILVTT